MEKNGRFGNQGTLFPLICRSCLASGNSQNPAHSESSQGDIR